MTETAKPKRTRAKSKQPAKRGPADWVPTDADRNLVRLGMFNGLPEKQIAAMLSIPGREKPGIDVKTLHKYFKEEISNGKAHLEVQLSGTLFRKAMGNTQGSVTAAIFLCKAKLGWKDRELVVAKPAGEGEGDSPAGNTPMTFTLAVGTA